MSCRGMGTLGTIESDGAQSPDGAMFGQRTIARADASFTPRGRNVRCPNPWRTAQRQNGLPAAESLICLGQSRCINGVYARAGRILTIIFKNLELEGETMRGRSDSSCPIGGLRRLGTGVGGAAGSLPGVARAWPRRKTPGCISEQPWRIARYRASRRWKRWEAAGWGGMTVITSPLPMMVESVCQLVPPGSMTSAV